MAPPQYSDLGKATKDLFNKGYNYGTFKLDVKTKTKNEIDIQLTGEHNQDINKSLGTLEAKYKSAVRNLTFSEKWNTDNILRSELSMENAFKVENLKVALETAYSPASGKKSGVLKTTYKTEKYMINTDVDLDLNGPVIHNSWVMSRFGWLFGWQSTFDASKMSLVRKNFAIGYQGPDFTLHTNVNDGTEVGASIYQRLNPQSELGMSLSWSSAANQTRLALAYKQQIDKNATFQAKVNNLNQVGLSYTQQLRDGIKLILSTLIDGKNLNGGGHKFGFGLELEP